MKEWERFVFGAILFLSSFGLVSYGLGKFDDVRLLGLDRGQKRVGLALALFGGIGLYCGLSLMFKGVIL